MKNLIKTGIILSVSALVFTSCGNQFEKMQKNSDQIMTQANPEMLTLVGNSVSTDVTVTFPEKFYQKDIILKVTPVLVFDGGEIAGQPKYFQGENVKENYTVVPRKAGGTFTNGVTMQYDPRADVSTLELRVEGRYAEHRRAEMTQFAPLGSFAVARGISTLQSLALPYMTVMPDNFKRVTTISEEANIQYQINSAAVSNRQLTQEQIKTLEQFVRDNQTKENVTLGNVQAKGYASPDGPEKFNDKLSANRSQSGERAIKGKLRNTGVQFDASYYGEDWEGFKKLVQESNIPDRDLILQVLAMYDSSAKREQEIRNLSFVFEDLKNTILPQLRRTRVIASADVQGKSDAEIIAAINRQDKSLNVEEMLYAATLVEPTRRADVYRLVAATYGDARAYNNLAIELVRSGDVEGAKKAIDQAARLASDPAITNNLAAVAIAQRDIATAKQYLATVNTPDATRNKAIIAIHEGDYTAAAKGLDGFSLAVAEVLNGNYAKAKTALGNESCAYAEYLRAIIAMREGNSNGALSYLKSAVAKDGSMAARAKTNVEFARLFDNAEFRAL